MSRQIFVVDPAWVQVEKNSYAAAWKKLVDESGSCGFIGLDLEWTPCVKFVSEEKAEEEMSAAADNNNNNNNNNNAEKGVRRKRKDTVGPVAVVQLSTFSVTFVIRLSDLVRMEGEGSCKDNAASSTLSVILNNLRVLLANKSVAKVGVNIIGDQEKLEHDYATLRLYPCVELVVLARRLFPTDEDVGDLRSLKDIAARFAAMTLKKDPFVACSDWGGRLGALSPLQVKYAAGEAEGSFDACFGMFKESNMGTDGNKKWGKSKDEGSEDAGELQNTEWTVKSLLHSLAGIKAKLSKKKKETQIEKSAGNGNTNKSAASWCKGRAKPYYDNIFVYDADMRLVFTVDKSKAEWYVHKKGIAKVIKWKDEADDNDDNDKFGETSNPQRRIAAIQLNFSPDFSKYNDAHIRRNLDYFRQAKENQCVVCGHATDLVRFAVVPLLYRKYFPSVYMSHNSYDLLLLCTSCFAKSRQLYDEERQRVARDFGVPLGHLKAEEVTLRRAELQKHITTTLHNNKDDINSNVYADETNVGGRTLCSDANAFLSSEQKMRIAEAYLDIEKHREILLNIFKYAKALRAANDVAVHAGDGQGEDENEKEVKEEEEEERVKRNTVRARQKRIKPAVIPPERSQQLAEYIRLHAPPYPFARCPSRQATLFTADAASTESLRCILEEGVSPRAVLTRFWLREHPDIRELFSTTTRRSESREGKEDEGESEGELLSASGSRDSEKREEGNFCVDSNGFLVVQAVLQKYDMHPCKSRDHAIGEFINRWRTTFLEGMRPKYLPSGWTAEDGILL